MEIKSLFSKVSVCLHSSEMFERPWVKIKGKWQLYEYFVDNEEELLHLTEADLDEINESLEISFEDDGNFSLTSNISIKRIENLKKGTWNVSRNFVTLAHSENFRDSLKFQIAFEKDKLKMLKKDASGKLEFFGFFRKLEPKS